MGSLDIIEFENKNNKNIELQFKNLLSNSMNNYYKINDNINLEDGIYFCLEGCFIIYNKKIVAAFDKNEEFLFDKWNNKLEYPDLTNNLIKWF